MPYRMAYTTTTALNLVPIIQSEANVIVDAQRLRAMQTFEKGRFVDKLKAYPALVTPLVIGSMRRAQRMAVAMDSRAFGASKSRTYIEDIHLRPADYLFIGGIVVFSALMLLGAFVI
jgi:energy-coupling factor transport system permease protein